VLTRRILLIAAALSVGGCGLDKQTVPSLAGPSSSGVTLAISASPDMLLQDGAATSFIQVLARDAHDLPIPNMTLRADILVGGSPFDLGALSAKSFTTNSSGRGTVVYTSPTANPSATSDTVVTLAFTPVGTNFANADPKGVEIRLIRPNAVPSSADLQALFTTAPIAPALGDTVAFDASTSKVGPGRTIVAYGWTFGDGGTASGKLATHVFTHAGSAAVTLTVTDDLGRTASTSKVINLGTVIASFTSQAASSPAHTMTFDASTSAAPSGRTIVSYDWNFGDPATTGTGATVTHTFPAAGAFTVILTVTDSTGVTATVSVVVTVG
jgi:PKD repeat protein